MSCDDLMNRGVFNFGSASDDDRDCVEEGTVENITFSQAIKQHKLQEKQQTQTNISRSDIRPFKSLSLTSKQVICIANETIEFDLLECYDKFLPRIANQLKELPETHRLQQLAWPHLLEGRSAIIIDYSDHLAELVYLPVICTQVEVN